MCVLLLFLSMTQAPAGAGNASDLASGPYSRMHMLLERTFLAIDVLTVDLRFDAPTQQRFRGIVADRAYSDRLAAEVVEAALRPNHIALAIEFQRNVSLDRWIEGVRDGLDKALAAGLIQAENHRRVTGGMRQWFQGIASRGFRRGDQVRYRGAPDSLRTVLVTTGGEVLLDQTDRGEGPRVALLAGFLAPGTDFREPLVRSLLQP
jgi:hypothetical protein